MTEATSSNFTFFSWFTAFCSPRIENAEEEKLQSKEPCPLKDLLKFDKQPSQKFVAFYQYLLDEEKSEEFLELWIALRNYMMLLRKYETEDEKASNDFLSTLKDFFDNSLDLNSFVGLPSKKFHPSSPEGNIGFLKILEDEDVEEIDVTERTLRKVSKLLSKRYLIEGAPKEVNLDTSLKRDALELIKKERKLDSTTVNLLWQNIYKQLKEDSFPRFLKFLNESNDTLYDY